MEQILSILSFRFLYQLTKLRDPALVAFQFYLLDSSSSGVKGLLPLSLILSILSFRFMWLPSDRKLGYPQVLSILSFRFQPITAGIRAIWDSDFQFYLLDSSMYLLARGSLRDTLPFQFYLLDSQVEEHCVVSVVECCAFQFYLLDSKLYMIS